MKLVCVTGMPGCGKEELLRIARERGFTVVRMGDVVREEATKRGLPMTDKAVGTFADDERKKNGYDIWARRTVPKLAGENVLIDGVRGPGEVQIYRTAFPNEVSVIAVHASPATRLERILSRHRPDDPKTESEFEARDARELTWGLGEVIALADFVIANEGHLDDLRSQTNEVLDEILSEGA